ncbi:MAG: class II fructose-bisphosphate aldolase [Candidatus Aenigmatarchaeota archaeon]
MLVGSKAMLLSAYRGGYAIGAFNTCNLEITKAIVAAANEMHAPVIISTSEGEAKYAGINYVAAILKAIMEKIPLALHLDHGKSLQMVRDCINAGYTSVHLDGSNMRFGENIRITKNAAKIAHRTNINVEGELGRIIGSSTLHKNVEIKEEDLTDPKMAKEFVKKTGINVLAVSIGNYHGLSQKKKVLDFNRLNELNKLKIPMALHGGSGIADNDIRRAIKSGIAKVNINTELRLAFVTALRDELKKDETVPYKIFPAAIEAVKDVVKKKIELFGSAGKI